MLKTDEIKKLKEVEMTYGFSTSAALRFIIKKTEFPTDFILNKSVENKEYISFSYNDKEIINTIKKISNIHNISRSDVVGILIMNFKR